MTQAEPVAPDFVTDSSTLNRAPLTRLFSAVHAATGVVAKVFLVHTMVAGIAIALIAVWANLDRSVGWGIAAITSLAIIHVFATPLVLGLAGSLAMAKSVEHLGIARSILAAATVRAGAVNPLLRNSNDFGALTQALDTAFGAVAQDANQAEAGRSFLIRRAARRIARRMVRIAARCTLNELDLAHRAGQKPRYETIDEWIGSRIDANVTNALSHGPRRALAIVLALQFILSAAVVSGAVSMSLPGRSAAPSNPSPTYP